MRLKFAAALVILGLLAMGLGVGQRTVWAPPETVTSTLSADAQQAPVTILEPALNDSPGSVEVRVKGEGDLVLAVGRASDVEAWVGDAAHLSVTGVDGEQLQSSYTEGEDQVPNPRGSDLWQSQETAEGELVYQWIDPAPGDWSILLASDGTKPAPSEISLTRANTEGTPWAIPLIVIGAVLTVLGLALLFGPKRSKPQPEAAVTAAEGTRAHRRQSEARSRQRGKTRPGTRRSVRTTAGAVGAALLSLALSAGLGVSAQASETPVPATSSDAPTAPSSSAPAKSSPAPAEASSSAPAGASESNKYPVVLPEQLERIVDSVADTVASADAAKDAKQLKSRAAGPALELRSSNYKIRAQNTEHRAPVPIASEPILAEMVTSTVEWPRTLVVVTQGEENDVPQALLLVQDSPRENYKLRSAVQMLPGTSFPQLAEKAGDTRTLPNDSADGLIQAPASALDAVADILTRKDSEFADQVAENTFVDQISAFQEKQIDANENADISFDHKVVEENTRSLRTGNGGALVFGYLSNSMTSTPEEEGGTVELDEDYAALAGTDSTEEGISITFGESVMLYVPPAGSSDKIQVIGAAQDLVSAKVMEK